MILMKVIGGNMKIQSIFVGVLALSLAIGVVSMDAKELSAQELFEQANSLFSRHEFESSEQAYLEALKADSMLQWAHHQLGRIYFSRNELERAFEEFNQEIVLHKDSANSFYMRGLTYVFLGDLELAEQDFRLFLDFKPNSEAGNNDFAQILFVQGKFNEAEQVLLRILSFHPGSFLADQGLGAVYLELGEFTKAKQYIQSTLDIVLTMDVSMFMKYYPSLNPKYAEKGIETIREGIRYNFSLAISAEQGLFDKQQVASKSFAPYFQSAQGEQRQGAVFLAASCEANFEHFSGECTVDTTPPTGSISASPSSVVTGQNINITVSGNDNIGIRWLNFFEGGQWKDCGGATSCNSGSEGWTITESTPGSYTFRGFIIDEAGNSIGVTSSTVTVIDPTPTSVSIFASPVGSVTNGTTVTYTAVADKDVSDTPYWIDIFKDDSWKKGCKSGATCSYNWSDSNTTSTFTAKIEKSDLSDVIATDSITTTWGKVGTQLPNGDFSLEPTSIISGATITIRGWLRDNSGNGIGGKPVQLLVANPYSCNAGMGAPGPMLFLALQSHLQPARDILHSFGLRILLGREM